MTDIVAYGAFPDECRPNSRALGSHDGVALRGVDQQCGRLKRGKEPDVLSFDGVFRTNLGSPLAADILMMNHAIHAVIPALCRYSDP